MEDQDGAPARGRVLVVDDDPEQWQGVPTKEGEESPAVHPLPGFGGLVAESPAMRDIIARAVRVAETDANLCIYGESGTGKELIARAIHYTGRRAQHPLVVFDCAAVAEGLVESEMFGHVKGSFTSAVSDREGVFEMADKGSLLLDEVGELSLAMQAKLLRVIQCREFRKVGGKHQIKVDVRILAATNRDLRQLVQAGKFREDLFYRLEVISLTLPPLRERKEDIPLLVDHFIQKFNRSNKKQIKAISPRALQALMLHNWPGNVRELENCIERWAVMSDEGSLETFDLNRLESGATTQDHLPTCVEIPWPSPLREVECTLILRTLQHVKGNRRRAAELLGISQRCLYYKLKDLRPDSSEEERLLRANGGQPSALPGRLPLRGGQKDVGASASVESSGPANGSRTVKVLPRPSPSDSAQIRPPCSSTSRLVRASPSPVPS